MIVILLNRNEVIRAGVQSILKDQYTVFGVSGIDAAVAVFDKSDGSERLFIVEIVGFRDPVERLSKLAPVIALTFDTRPDSVAKAITAGAVAYLHVSCPASILRSTVDAVFATSDYMTDTSSAIASVVEDYRRVLGVITELNATEILILRYLALGAATKEISTTIGFTPKHVSNVVSEMSSKLGMTRLQMALWAERHGFGIPLEEAGYES
jgi:DNA-binding NarL/FixJ family response regulator